MGISEVDGKIPSFFYSNHFLEVTVLLLFCVGQHQVLCEPTSEVFAGYLKRVGLRVWSTNLVLMWAAAPWQWWCLAGHTRSFLCQKGDVHFTALSVWVPMGFMGWNTQKLSHQSHAASLGVEEEQNGRRTERLLVRGAVATGGEGGQKPTSTSILEWIRQCTLISLFFNEISARGILQVPEWPSSYSTVGSIKQNHSVAFWLSFPSCKLEEIFPKDAVRIIRLHWRCGARDHVSPSERELSSWQLL